MRGLGEERSEKGRGGRKMERKCQQQGPMEANYENCHTSQWPDQPHPYPRENRGRTTHIVIVWIRTHGACAADVRKYWSRGTNDIESQHCYRYWLIEALIRLSTVELFPTTFLWLFCARGYHDHVTIVSWLRRQKRYGSGYSAITMSPTMNDVHCGFHDLFTIISSQTLVMM